MIEFELSDGRHITLIDYGEYLSVIVREEEGGRVLYESDVLPESLVRFANDPDFVT